MKGGVFDFIEECEIPLMTVYSRGRKKGKSFDWT